MKINNMEELAQQLSKGKVKAKAESGDKEGGNKTKTQSGWSVVPVFTKSITRFGHVIARKKESKKSSNKSR